MTESSDPTICTGSGACPSTATCGQPGEGWTVGICYCGGGVYNDDSDCGGCGNTCGSNQTCSSGTCVAVNLCGNGGCASTNCSNVTNVGQKCNDGMEYAGGNLEITPVDAGLMSWYSAQTYCQSLGAGWSLPSVEQLSTMNVIANNDTSSSQNNTLGMSTNYWSSTQTVLSGTDNLSAWLNFRTGVRSLYYEYYPMAVRCVRSLQ